MTTTVRHPVLNGSIPPGWRGRQITRLERARLAELGVAVPVRTCVVRAFETDYLGALYRPSNSGLSDLGVSVKMKEA